MVWSEFCVESNNFALAGVWLGLNSVKFRNFALGHANFTMYVDFIGCKPLVRPICHMLVSS
jgi:hypothetical protein